MEDLEQQVQAYTFYVEAVKRNGIPYELISKVLPSIQAEINNILSQIAEFTIVLEVDGKNINGKMVYSDNKYWPLEMASGMERFISSLAIRVALITISNLPKPNFLIIDEGIGTLSAENLPNMHTLFSILKNQFDFIIIISHLEAVRDMVDSLMEISLDDGFSRINY
jgi:DNA repair exonuclease SbcCD ATPase subunit